MDNNVKQNDWVAINLLNTDVTIDKLAADGINSLNTSIRPKEDKGYCPRLDKTLLATPRGEGFPIQSRQLPATGVRSLLHL